MPNKVTLQATLVALCTMLSAGAYAIADTPKQVDIPAGDLSIALLKLSKQYGADLVYRPEQVHGLRTHGAHGSLTTKQAATQLLEGTPLELRTDASGAMLIAPPIAENARGTQHPSALSAEIDANDDPKEVGKKTSQDFRVAQVDQTAAGPSALGQRRTEEKQTALEEIVVTATRREQNIQTVPMSITALGQGDLQALGASNFSDFARTVPGLTFNDNGPNRANFVIRGITSDVTGGTLQSTVGLYIDDLPTLDSYAGIATPDLHLFDVNRVEVLRGPQGTLFGSGSMGGAIRVITNKPDLTAFAGSVEAGASDTDGGTGSYTTNAMVNVPLVPDVLALRAVGYYQHDGGWIDNTLRGFNLNSNDTYGARVALKFAPTSALSITGTVTTQNSEPNDGSYYTGLVDGTPIRSVASAEFIDNRFTVSNLVVEYEFPGMKLRSSTSYADKTVLQQLDQTPTSRAIFGADTPDSFVQYADHSGNFFEELHLYSTGDRSLDWFVGAFYRDQPHRLYDFSWIVPGSEATLGSGATGAPGNNVYSYIDRESTREEAIFGEISYKLIDKLQATVGMRYFNDSYSDLNTSSNYLAGGFKQTPLAATDSKATYKFVLNYQLSPQQMVYAEASEGYRVGGANPVVPVPTPSQFGPDSLWNYELGAKSTWLDGKLKLNGAVYFIDWRQMQLSVYTAGIQGYEYTANVGTTHSKGAELEATAILAQGLEYTGGISYNDARIQVNNPAINAVAGDRVPGSPHLTLSNALQYTFHLAGQTEMYAHLDHEYVSGSLSVFDPALAVHMGNYSLLNGRLGVRFGGTDIALFAKNMLNSDAVTTAVRATLEYRLQPLTVGVTARMTF